MRHALVTLLALLFASCSALACFQEEYEVPTVPGPEAEVLVGSTAGYIAMDRPVGGLVAVRVADGAEVVLREKGKFEDGLVHSVSGPDARGRVAFVANFMTEDRHALKVAFLDGSPEVVLFEAKGDALWGNSIGGELALSRSTGRVAFVVDKRDLVQENPSALLEHGTLVVWDVVARKQLEATTSAIDDQLSWFPDGRRVAYSAFVDRERAVELVRLGDDGFGEKLLQWKQVPVIHVLDVESGEVRALHVGLRPAVSSDGRKIVFRDFELRWRLLDLETSEVESPRAPGSIYPGPIAFTAPDRVLYWAWPTEGASTSLTEHNSPLVGQKAMRTLKIYDLESGAFQTALPAVDPRRHLSYGVGP